MKLHFSDNAKDKIMDLITNPRQRIILDFDDGVGPFSPESNCSLDLAFNLVITERRELPDFQPLIISNLGDIWAKPYSLEHMDEAMTLDFDPKYGRYQLSGRQGILDPAVTIKSL